MPGPGSGNGTLRRAAGARQLQEMSLPACAALRRARGWRGGGRSRAEDRHRALTAACSLTRASPAPQEPLTPLRNLLPQEPLQSSSQEPLASGTRHGSPQEPLTSGVAHPSPQEPLSSGTAIPALRNPSARLPLRKGSLGARGMGRSRCPLTFVQVRDRSALSAQEGGKGECDGC